MTTCLSFCPRQPYILSSASLVISFTRVSCFPSSEREDEEEKRREVEDSKRGDIDEDDKVVVASNFSFIQRSMSFNRYFQTLFSFVLLLIHSSRSQEIPNRFHS